MEFDGAQVETGINTPPETWQIDFTARMAGMNERQRRENVDIYGAAAFFGDVWRVDKTGKQFFIIKGGGAMWPVCVLSLSLTKISPLPTSRLPSCWMCTGQER